MPGSDKLNESHKMQIGDFFFSQAFTEIYVPGYKGWHSRALQREMQKYKEENPIFFLSNPIKPTISFQNSSTQLPDRWQDLSHHLRGVCALLFWVSARYMVRVVLIIPWLPINVTNMFSPQLQQPCKPVLLIVQIFFLSWHKAEK